MNADGCRMCDYVDILIHTGRAFVCDSLTLSCI